MTETATLGHNSGDEFAAFRADVQARVAAFLQGADIWAERDDLDEPMAARANDFLTGAKKLMKEAEEARKAEKAPHIAAAADVDAEWGRIKTRIEKVCDVVRPLLDRFLRAKQERERKAREEAERKQREAEEAQRAAEADAAKAETPSARIEAEERAAEHQRLADRAADQAKRASAPVRAESATGLANKRGLKTVRRAKITSLAMALAHYRDRPELADLILQLANAELRHAPTISGEKQIPTIPGVVFEESQELAA